MASIKICLLIVIITYLFVFNECKNTTKAKKSKASNACKGLADCQFIERSAYQGLPFSITCDKIYYNRNSGHNVSWFKDGDLLNIRSLTKTDGRKLSFKKIKLKDSGIYRCQSFVDGKKKMLMINLTVERKWMISWVVVLG